MRAAAPHFGNVLKIVFDVCEDGIEASRYAFYE
jgi:hypothetical protein